MANENEMQARLLIRNDTAARWAEVNPTLMKGEWGRENDTDRWKVGDGITEWNDLDYADKSLYKAIADEKARAETAEKNISDKYDAANGDLAKITALLKNGATLDEAKTALAEFGDGYKDLYQVANTLYSFLSSADASNSAINRWKEIENFLQGITDVQTLTGILEELKTTITTAYQNAIKVETDRATQAETDLSKRVTNLEKFMGDSDEGLSEIVDEAIDSRLKGDVFILDGGNASGHTA